MVIGGRTESRAWRARLLGVLLAGALVRAAALPLPGTGDVTIWQGWSFAAAHDPTGMYGVGVTWGFRSAEELRTHGARALATTADELLAALRAARG